MPWVILLGLSALVLLSSGKSSAAKPAAGSGGAAPPPKPPPPGMGAPVTKPYPDSRGNIWRIFAPRMAGAGWSAELVTSPPPYATTNVSQPSELQLIVMIEAIASSIATPPPGFIPGNPAV